jgi:hypothetical protein
MNYIILNCRGVKITIDDEIIKCSKMLSTYQKNMLEGLYKKEDEFYINCRSDKMHDVLDILPNEGQTQDEDILKICDYLCIDKITKNKTNLYYSKLEKDYMAKIFVDSLLTNNLISNFYKEIISVEKLCKSLNIEFNNNIFYDMNAIRNEMNHIIDDNLNDYSKKTVNKRDYKYINLVSTISSIMPIEILVHYFNLMSITHSNPDTNDEFEYIEDGQVKYGSKREANTYHHNELKNSKRKFI